MTRTRTVRISPRLVAAIRRDAARYKCSPSACVERAWAIAWPRIARLAAPTPIEQNFDEVPPIPCLTYTNARAEAIYVDRFAAGDGEVEELELALDPDVYEDLVDESYRLARSLSWLVTRAWCIALDVELSAAWYRANDFASESPEAGDTMPMPRYE